MLISDPLKWNECYGSYRAGTLATLGYDGAYQFRLERVDVPTLIQGLDEQASVLWPKSRNDPLYASTGVDSLRRVGDTLVLKYFPMRFALLNAAKAESSPLHEEIDAKQLRFLREELHVLSVASYLRNANKRYVTGVKAGTRFTGRLRELVPQGLLHNGGELDEERDPFLENLLRELEEETGFTGEDLAEKRLFGIDWSAQTGDFTPLYGLELKSPDKRQRRIPRLSDEHSRFDFMTGPALREVDRHHLNPVSVHILQAIGEYPR